MMDQRSNFNTIDGSLSNSFQGTLDEPVKETIIRDLKSIGRKLRYVLLPAARTEGASGLRDWDLWGPLVLCLGLSVILWAQAFDSQKKLVFSLIFLIIWIGSLVVTANTVLLGGKVSFFQSVCVLGYCLFPLDIAATLCLFVPASLAFIKILLLAAALYWSTGASVPFMSELVPQDRRALAVYPVWLFYVLIAWIILLV